MAKSTYLSPMCHDDSLALKHWGDTNAGLNSALDYVRRGWQVIPIHSPSGSGSCTCSAVNCQNIAKHPHVRNGLKDASSDPMQVLHWWQTYPNANIGIVTGQQSNLTVLDIDAKNNGISSLQKLEAQYGPLPLSKRVNTGGGGLHIYFAHPGEPIRNRVNLLPGIDFRGDGGYVVAPPSRHGSGGTYEWQLANEELAPMPSWLLRMLQENIPPSATPAIQPAIAMIPEGTRNNTLVSIGGFLQAKGISGQALENVLAAVNSNACHPQLAPAEIAGIAKSLRRYKDETPWPGPEELPEQLATLQSLCANDLPPSLRPWLTDIATRMQIPLEFVAGPALISCATLLGARWVYVPSRTTIGQSSPIFGASLLLSQVP